jgi:RNA polymerase sigma factor for flagellar operon FliA
MDILPSLLGGEGSGVTGKLRAIPEPHPPGPLAQEERGKTAHWGREGTVSAQVYQNVSAQTQREELILGNLTLVRHILGRLASKLPRGIDVDNLEAAGVLGLVEAANRYEAERGISFKTFAYSRIRGAIYDELRRNCPLPQDLLEKTAKVRKIMQTLSPPVSIEILAQQTGLTEEDVTDCLAAMRLTRSVSWDDIPAFTNGHLADPADRPDLLLENEERKKLLLEAIMLLPETERLSITLYYMEDLRLKEIGRVLDLSESRVSRLLKSAEHHIEEHIRAKEDDAA